MINQCKYLAILFLFITLINCNNEDLNVKKYVWLNPSISNSIAPFIIKFNENSIQIYNGNLEVVRSDFDSKLEEGLFIDLNIKIEKLHPDSITLNFIESESLITFYPLDKVIKTTDLEIKKSELTNILKDRYWSTKNSHNDRLSKLLYFDFVNNVDCIFHYQYYDSNGNLNPNYQIGKWEILRYNSMIILKIQTIYESFIFLDQIEKKQLKGRVWWNNEMMPISYKKEEKQIEVNKIKKSLISNWEIQTIGKSADDFEKLPYEIEFDDVGFSFYYKDPPKLVIGIYDISDFGNIIFFDYSNDMGVDYIQIKKITNNSVTLKFPRIDGYYEYRKINAN